MANLTKLRRTAQVIEDLITLEIIKVGMVTTKLFDGKDLMITIHGDKEYFNKSLIEQAFRQEFLNEVDIFGDGKIITIYIEYIKESE